MNNQIKRIIIYTIFIISAIGFFKIIDNWHEKNISIQNNILIKEARTLYSDQINFRNWNSMYGGVYVTSHQGQKPNPYLKNNILKVDENLTLLKVNPAWMIRQLSELLDTDSYKFRITGFNPINPKNKATDFELEALNSFSKTNKEYYKFTSSDTFNYMGVLITEPSCLTCHDSGKYKVGEISGGISIKLNSKKHNEIIEDIKIKSIYSKVLIFIFLFIITVLLDKQIRNNELLHKEVDKRTIEIESTKELMQKILDADMSFLFLTDKKEIIYTNKTVLDFAGYSSLEDFNLHLGDIASKFEPVDDDDFLRPSYEDIHWIDYLLEEQKNRNLKVLIMHNGIKIYLKPHAKKIHSNSKTIYLISFDVITNQYEEMQALEEKASVDHLTNLFNRGKIDEILIQEMKLSNTVKSPLSIIFLDIDHFKKVNDTLGHDVGDTVLIALAKILIFSTRKADFVGRWGGEEFIIALQSTTKKEAGILAEKIREEIQNHKFKEVGNITISLGVTQFINGEDKESMIRRADEALYDAKENGRNQVIIS